MWCPGHDAIVEHEMQERQRAFRKAQEAKAASDATRKLEDDLDARIKRQQIWDHRNDGKPQAQATQSKDMDDLNKALVDFNASLTMINNAMAGTNQPQPAAQPRPQRRPIPREAADWLMGAGRMLVWTPLSFLVVLFVCAFLVGVLNVPTAIGSVILMLGFFGLQPLLYKWSVDRSHAFRVGRIRRAQALNEMHPLDAMQYQMMESEIDLNHSLANFYRWRRW